MSTPCVRVSSKVGLCKRMTIIMIIIAFRISAEYAGSSHFRYESNQANSSSFRTKIVSEIRAH